MSHKIKFFVLLVLVLASFAMAGCDSDTNYNLSDNMDAARDNQAELQETIANSPLAGD